MLDGSIFYELKDQNPFIFKLHLPDGVSKQQTNIDDLLEANVVDSISLKSFIESEKPNGLGIVLPEIGNVKPHWRKYCVETCYGFWNPSELKIDLETDLKRRIDARRDHFLELKKIVFERKSDLRKSFMNLCTRISARIENLSAEEWKYANIENACAAWDKWYESLEEKIQNEKFFDRIISGIATVPSPDVWNDQLSASEFEESFCESLLYCWSKEYTNETSNLVASAIANIVDISSTQKDNCNAKSLATIIDKFLAKNRSTSLFE